MFLDLGRIFEPDWSGVPPHMSGRDYIIWRRWQEAHWPEYTGFYFDAAVGTPVQGSPGLTDIQQRGLDRASVKRIDAIGIQKRLVRVIEVRPNASSSAGGAVLLYTYLLQQSNPFKVPMEGMILSDLSDPDSEAWFHSLGIRLELVGPVLEAVEI
ncbi:MAG: hypothetical protein WAP47_01320 [Candidatus Rokuibacteriota bacterium]